MTQPAPTRNRVYRMYESDNGVAAGAMLIPERDAAETSRGWTTLTAIAGLLARGYRPRRVHGVDATGFRGSAVVASPTAALWTNAATTFTILGNDGTFHTCTVTSRTGERQRLGRP